MDSIDLLAAEIEPLAHPFQILRERGAESIAHNLSAEKVRCDGGVRGDVTQMSQNCHCAVGKY